MAQTNRVYISITLVYVVIQHYPAPSISGLTRATSPPPPLKTPLTIYFRPSRIDLTARFFFFCLQQPFGTKSGFSRIVPSGENPGATTDVPSSASIHTHSSHTSSRILIRTRGPDQRPVAVGAGALPHVLGHDNLRPLLDPLVEDVGPEDVPLTRGTIVPRQRERQRRASVVVPHLVRVELVPDGLARVALEQVVDEGADGAVVHPHGVLERLDEVALFGVGHEPELFDDLLRAVVLLVDRLPVPG